MHAMNVDIEVRLFFIIICTSSFTTCTPCTGGEGYIIPAVESSHTIDINGNVRP